MRDLETDIVVAGGGAAGLATGIALAKAGLRVLIVGVPETIRDDARSAALLRRVSLFSIGMAWVSRCANVAGRCAPFALSM